MRKFKNLHRKEQVEYIAVLALFPLFLLFQWLGKSIKCLSTKQRQLTASVLCALLIIGMFPLTVFADSGKLTVVTEFNVNNNKIDVGNSPDNYWSYGTNTAVIAKNVASLPEDGWTWAIQTKLSTAEYTIKLNNYNGSYIIASNIHSYSNNNCSVNLELSGQNTITSPYYGLRFSLCDIFMHGNGSLKIDVTKTSSAVDTHSLTVDLPSNKALDISASSSSEIGSNGIHVSSDFTLNSGTVNVNITSSSTSEKYGAVGISAATLTVNSGTFNIASSNSNTDGISYGIRGNSTYNEEKREYEYPAKVYFNGGSVEISAGTKATDTFYAPETSDDFTLWAGKAADKSDKKIYDPAKFDSYLYYTTEHKHCKCGAVDTHDESNLCSSYYPQTYKPWTDSSSLPTYGYYYLSTDVTLSKTWEITETVNLCLNGHSIIADGDFDAIKISSSLNLTDCAPTEKQGKITHTPGTEGRGIVTEKANNYSTRLYMYGGNITGNTAENGAGIYCAANICIRIKGGSITNNIATGNGGGIYCEGDMDIDDGNITGNTATIGGGIYVTKGSDTYSDSDALRITGGNITGNTATEKGGGVYANHYVVLRGYVNYIKNPYGLPLCTATVLNNTSGPKGNKKTDNISFAPGQYLNIYNNFKGGNVSLNFTGAGTKIAIPYGNLTSKLWVNDLILSGIHCDDPKYSPVIDKTNNAVLLRSSLKDLSASDFEFTAPRGFTYTGEAKTATVTAKDGINCGTITVKYFDENHRQVYAPTEAGKYTVSIDVEENDTYAALTGIHDENWTFTITPKEISYSKILITGIDDTYIYTGSAIEPTAYVTVESMGLYQGRDYTISYKNNTEVGTATVVITLKGNYSGSRQTDFSITYGHASEIMYSMPAANANGWYSSDIIVTAINGYKIGETAQSFSDTLTLTGDTAKGGKQVFL